MRSRRMLQDAESELEERRAELRALETKIRRRLGNYVDRLAELEEEITRFSESLSRKISPMDVNSGYLPVEEQYRLRWETAPAPDMVRREVKSTGEYFDFTDEKQVKRLYRLLARQYHPDLARDSSEIEYRTRKMTDLNKAYASRSLLELASLASESDLSLEQDASVVGPLDDIRAALNRELAQIQASRMRVESELKDLQNSPILALSLESKLAQRSGRDLLGEVILNLKQKIVVKQRERDQLKHRLENINNK